MLTFILMKQVAKFSMYPLFSEPRHEKTCFMLFATNKATDQPAHPHSLISAFVVGCLDSMISKLVKLDVAQF